MNKRKLLDFSPTSPASEEWRAQVFYRGDEGQVQVIERGLFPTREEATAVARAMKDEAGAKGLNIVQVYISSEVI